MRLNEITHEDIRSLVLRGGLFSHASVRKVLSTQLSQSTALMTTRGKKGICHENSLVLNLIHCPVVGYN